MAAGSLSRRLRRLWPYFGRPLWVWAAAAGATLILALSEPLIPALLQPLLDRGFQQGQLALWAVPVALILLFAVRGMCSFTAQLAMTKITSSGLTVLRKAMFDKLLGAQLTLFSGQTSSALANTIVYEVQTGSTLLVSALMTLVRNSLTLAALLGYLMYLNWKLTLIVVFLFPAVALCHARAVAPALPCHAQQPGRDRQPGLRGRGKRHGAPRHPAAGGPAVTGRRVSPNSAKPCADCR